MSAELQYSRQLRRVARVVGSIIEPHIDGYQVIGIDAMKRALDAYSENLGPWAVRVALDMLRQVAASNKRAVASEDKRFTAAFRETITESQVGLTQQVLLREQVDLIKSLPTKAAERVQTLATEAMINGTRAAQVAEDLRNTTKVTEARAMLIARTEIAKSNSTLTEARSRAVGSNNYIWRTAGDEAVRESHAEMEGQIVNWDQPPTLSDGTTTHAGQIYNCRCYAEPILPELD